MPYIKKLHLHGFKSFAKPTEVLFDKGLNVIVGPNGSGKSNLVEAICFVLGRLKMRTLRATRAAHLIYDGGKENKPAPYAKVSLVFDNSDRVFSLPTSEIEITRIVKRDGTSIYKINGETKTRQEILELLAQAGIDPEGFNIILQAEINNIVEMHPEEKRRIIEEVAGIHVYEERKEKSLHELQKTEEKLKEIRTVLNERSAFLRNLEKEKAQAERYENLKKAIRLDKACLVLKQLKEKEKEMEKINKKIEEKKEQLNKLQQKANAIQAKIVEINKQIQEINAHIEKKSGIEQEQLFQEISRAREMSAILNVKLENYQEQLAAIERRAEQLKHDEEELIQEIERLEKEKEKKIEKGVDAVTFKQEILNAAYFIRATSEEAICTFRIILDNIKERKNTIENAIKQNKIKTVVEEMNAFIYLLETNLPKLDKNLRDITELATKISKLKIGKEEERNIALEIELARKELERIRNIIKKSVQERKEMEHLISGLKEELSKRKKEIEEKEKLEQKIRKNFEKLLVKKSELESEAKKEEIALKEQEVSIRMIENEINTLSIAKAKLEAEYEVAKQNYEQYQDLKDQLEKITLSRVELEARIARNEKALAEIGAVNLRALEVYDKVKAEYDEIAEKVATLEKEKNEILKIIEEIDRKKKRAFMQTFNNLNQLFQENFMALSNKGKASLELENKQDPFAGGVDIVIKLAKGKERNVGALSGGEKVIVALALLFAIQKYRPYYFYVFDEIDPALDKRNSEMLANMLKNGKQSQYIIITHNDALINIADRLYGTSMQEGISKVVSLKV